MIAWIRPSKHARDEKLAVLCLDLDHFKDVNDTLGHPVGDLLLKAVADRLRHCIGETDTVARLGGDEFAIVQLGASQPTDATTLATRLTEAINAPFELDGHHVVVGISIGIAIAPDDGTDPHQLLKNADMALYRAKADGRGAFRFFEAEMDARMQARRALELDLRKAVAQRRVRVVLSAARRRAQPARSAASRRCCAGIIPSAAWSRRPSSFRSRRRPG